MVKNCSKEQPSSIETETLKNGFFITIVTSKESNFDADFKYISFVKFKLLTLIDTSKESDSYADFKYISFIHFILPIKSYEAEKICLILENMEKQPLKVVES